MTTLRTDPLPDVPRNDIIRGLSPLKVEDDGNTMIGYPIVFNQWTEIDSWEGQFLERVLPSGPVQTLKANSDRIKVQYNHGMHPVIGTSGLGKPRSLTADGNGVYSEVPLSQTSYNRDIIKPLLADGTLDGMSFRFSVVEDRWIHPKKASSYNPNLLPERSLVEFKWHEFGPVDWPAYEAASAGIRSQAGLAMWMQTPTEQRSQIMRQFDISVSHEPRVWAPGWEPSKREAKPEARATDETPEELVVSLDATFDAIGDALDNDDLEIAKGLVTAGDAVVDDLMDLMGIPDPDESDSGAPRGHRPAGATRTTEPTPADETATGAPTKIPPAGETATEDENTEPADAATRDDDPPTPAPRISAERIAMTLDYVESRLIRSRARSDLYASRVDDLERHLTKD